MLHGWVDPESKDITKKEYQKTTKLSITDLDDDLIDEDDLLNSYNLLMSGLTTSIPDKNNNKDSCFHHKLKD